jgi:hypothetical protein
VTPGMTTNPLVPPVFDTQSISPLAVDVIESE